MVNRRTLVVRTKQQCDDTLFRVKLEDVTGEAFKFSAGQFMSLAVAGFMRRSYSILNPPGQSTYVETIVDTRPGGPGSRFFTGVQVGDEVDALMPLGSFVYIPDPRPAYFIATGTGIVPLFSMIADALSTQPDRELNLFYGVRSKSRIAIDADLDELAAQHANFKPQLFISQPNTDWEGPIGRVTSALNDLPNTNAQAYICGNGEMIREVADMLKVKGFNSADIMYERFY